MQNRKTFDENNNNLQCLISPVCLVKLFEGDASSQLPYSVSEQRWLASLLFGNAFA